jgi:S1-C subfamily serine protease
VKSMLWTVTPVLIAVGSGLSGADKQNANNDANRNETRQANQAYLGVTVENIPQAFRSQMPDLLPSGQGILVMRIAKEGPANKAGIQPHDILLTFGGQVITSPDQLVKLVRGAKPGQTVDVG